MSRRVLVAGAGTVAGVAVLAACGSDEPAGGNGASGSGDGPDGSGDGAGGSGDGALVEVAEVPVGGAVAVETSDGEPLIISQPSEGEIVAFSAICTHKGCEVAPGDGQIECPCHGSTFDLATGENTGGPAPKPLPKVEVVVDKGEVHPA